MNKKFLLVWGHHEQQLEWISGDTEVPLQRRETTENKDAYKFGGCAYPVQTLNGSQTLLD